MKSAFQIMKLFSATIYKIGINPYVGIPEEVLERIFEQAGKSRGPISVRGTMNGQAFTQTLVKYQGAAGVDVGDCMQIHLEFDPTPRVESMPIKLADAFARNKPAKMAFESLPRSRRKEILRYLNSMKTEESLERNVERVLKHLLDEKTAGIRQIPNRSK